MTSIKILAFALALGLAAGAAAQDHDHGGSTGDQLGTVTFETSCSAAAQPRFTRGVALLHSFEFGRAIEAFRTALDADPSCAIAEWGIALSDWSNPFGVGIRPAAPLKLGREAVERARKLGPKTERERAYVDAVSQLYDQTDTIDQRTRLVAYRDAMGRIASRYATDSEASIFYALAISAVAAATPLDASYAEPLKAGAILERLIVTQPNHPGLAHTGAIATIKASVGALQRITDALAAQKEMYWAEQTEIQRREASALLARAEGRNADALAGMRAAAEMEDRTEKAAVTPGPLAPARELLGQMLLELAQPSEALKEFEATLKKEPNRFRAVYGAATAAAKAGDRARARTYYGQLLKICERADTPGRPELQEARTALIG